MSAAACNRVRVLLAVTADPRPTVRSVAARCGLSVARTHAILRDLRAEGLVHWREGQAGTLRSRLRIVAVNP